MTSPKNLDIEASADRAFEGMLSEEASAIRTCRKALDKTCGVDSALRVVDWLHNYYECIADVLEKNEIKKTIDPDGDAKWKDSLRDEE